MLRARAGGAVDERTRQAGLRHMLLGFLLLLLALFTVALCSLPREARGAGGAGAGPR
ncbi:MAG TPA: hypothetical protein VFV36_08235 [Candidatus Methylomirabilis sp.]|nr:hypothetical protein [Candidatus Methylomirabilis sp.]